MMAWGIHFPHAAITSPERVWCTLRHASGHLYFRNAVSIPWKGNALEDHLSRGATMLMLGMIRLKMTNAAR